MRQKASESSSTSASLRLFRTPSMETPPAQRLAPLGRMLKDNTRTASVPALDEHRTGDNPGNIRFFGPAYDLFSHFPASEEERSRVKLKRHLSWSCCLQRTPQRPGSQPQTPRERPETPPQLRALPRGIRSYRGRRLRRPPRGAWCGGPPESIGRIRHESCPPARLHVQGDWSPDDRDSTPRHSDRHTTRRHCRPCPRPRRSFAPRETRPLASWCR